MENLPFQPINLSFGVVLSIIVEIGGCRGLEVKLAPSDQGVCCFNPAAASYFDLFPEDQPIDVLEKDALA